MPPERATIEAPRACSPEDFTTVRDRAVFIGQLSQVSVEQLKAAIAQGERALGLGAEEERRVD